MRVRANSAQAQLSLPETGFNTAMERVAREELRHKFMPARVGLLFVGESPPAGGTFFYAADSGLFRATRDAFCDAIEGCERFDSFLDCFMALGCYLEDLCHEPVNHLIGSADGSKSKRLEARRAGESHLARTIAQLQPLVIIVLLKAIEENVERAAAAAGFAQTERYVLTYPSRWHRHRLAYRRELAALLRDMPAQRRITFIA